MAVRSCSWMMTNILDPLRHESARLLLIRRLRSVHSRQRGRGGASSPELLAHRFARAMPMRIALPSSPSRASTAFAISIALSRTRGGSLPIAGGYRSVVQGMANSSEWTIAQRGRVGEFGACETGGQCGERYKDVTAVVDAAQQAGLARKVARLRPLVCVKG